MCYFGGNFTDMEKLCFFFWTVLSGSLTYAQTNYVANTANSATPGSNNTLVGPGAGNGSMTGTLNLFLGHSAGNSNTNGAANVFAGRTAGYLNTSGNYNVFVGEHAGYDNATGGYNTFVGFTVARSNTTGRGNVAVGARAGYINQTGNNNTAVGDSAGFNNSVSNNVFLGSHAGYTNSTGTRNTYLGYRAGYNASTGSGNVFVGYRAGEDHGTASNKLYVANDLSKTILYGDFATGQLLVGKPDATGYVFKGTRKLNVVGGILTDSIRVAHVIHWSDHVFADDYKLMNLADLGSFIKRHHHLPGIPAQHEVEEQGVDLLAMNTKLLEKVEELTLYILAQQKQIDALKLNVEKINTSRICKD